MTIIRVTPEILALTSTRMAQVNGEIQAAVRDLSSVLNGIGGEYGGQLRNQVAPRVSQAQGAASGPSNQVNQLTLELNRRAQLFAAADLQYTAVAGTSAQLRNQGSDAQFDVWALLAKLSMTDLLTLLQMGTLLGIPYQQIAILALLISPSNQKFLSGLYSKIPLPSWWPGKTQTPELPISPKSPMTKTISPPGEILPPAFTRLWSKEEIDARSSKLAQRMKSWPKNDEQCVEWAIRRRQELGGSILPATGIFADRTGAPKFKVGENIFRDVGAEKYINIYQGSVRQINESNADELWEDFKPGAALVWTAEQMPGSGGAGHIAIIEAVDGDRIWISQANIPGKVIVSYSKEELAKKGIYLIPIGAKPVETTNFDHNERYFKM